MYLFSSATAASSVVWSRDTGALALYQGSACCDEGRRLVSPGSSQGPLPVAGCQARCQWLSACLGVTTSSSSDGASLCRGSTPTPVIPCASCAASMMRRLTVRARRKALRAPRRGNFGTAPAIVGSRPFRRGWIQTRCRSLLTDCPPRSPALRARIASGWAEADFVLCVVVRSAYLAQLGSLMPRRGPQVLNACVVDR